MADVVVGAGRRGRRRARAGLPLLAARADAGRARGPTCGPCTSCTRPSPTRPCSASCPTTAAGELLRRPGRLRRLRVPLPRVGGRLHAPASPTRLATAGTATADLRRAARYRRRRARGRGGLAGGGGRRGGAAGRGRRAPHRRAGRPHRAVEEHPARACSAFEELLGHPSGVARPGRARRARLPVAAGPGRVSRLRRRGGAHGRADQPRVRGTAERGRRSSSTSRTTGPGRSPR